MARNKNINAAAVAAAAVSTADTVLGTLRVSLSPEVTTMSAAEIFTYAVASESRTAPANVGRDAVHGDDLTAARAVSLRDGQFTPLIVTLHNDQTVVVDGAGRLDSARMIIAGFDFGGKSYPATPDFALMVRYVARGDGEDMPLADIITLARYLNANKNNAGVAGMVSMARTAARFREAGKKGRELVAVMVECGFKVDESLLSRLKALMSLAVNMQEAILLNDSDRGAGIGFSVIAKHLVKGENGKIKVPTAAQFEAYKSAATYTETITVDGTEVTGTKIDYRGRVLDAWYAANFDLTADGFDAWKPNGTSVPVKPATPEQAKVKEVRDEFSWKVLGDKIGAQAIKADAVTGYAMNAIYLLIDRVSYAATEAKRATRLTGTAAALELRVLLESLANGTLTVPVVEEPAATDATDAANA